MRTAYEEDELELDAERASSRELTLSSTTLLAIFFALVLVCGLFFGFGYTMGRRSPSEATIEPTSVQAATTPFSSQPKPSAASPSVAAKPQPASPSEVTLAADQTGNDSSQPESVPQIKPSPAALPQVKPAAATKIQVAAVAKPSPQVKPAFTPASQNVTPEAAAPAAAIMVQIAAVSDPADAEALVSALHKHGYTASVHRQSTDTLNHVQIGPFATRAEAIAMRQKLQADGYNAIMK
jgi:DedD protein